MAATPHLQSENLISILTFGILISFTVNVAQASYSSSIDLLALQYTDETVQDLVERYERSEHYNFWHPSTKSEVHSREVITIGAVRATNISGEYTAWKSARLGHKIIFVALATDEIQLFDQKLQPLQSIQTQTTLVAFTAFSHWNDHLSKPELIVIAATRKPSLLVFSFINNAVTHVGTWPLHHSVKSLELCVVEFSRKVIVIPQNPRASIDIYNFESHNSSSQFWFFQRLKLGDRECLAVQEIDAGCKVAFKSNEKISVWSYDSHAKMFQEQHSFMNVTSSCKQLVPFKLAYCNYFALIPVDGNYAIEFYGEKGRETLNQRAPLFATEIAAVPINDFKGEDILVVRTPANETKIYALDGITRVFREGYGCATAECPKVKLSHSTAAVVNGTSILITPLYTSNNFSVALMIQALAEEHISPLFERFRTFYNHFRILADLYKRFQLAVMNVSAALDDVVSPSEHNTVTGNWTINRIRSAKAVRSEGHNGANPAEIGSVTFLHSSLQPKDFAVSDNQVASELNGLERLLAKGKAGVDQTVPRDSMEEILVRAPQLLNATIRSNHIKSERLVTNAINDVHELEQLLESLVVQSSDGSAVNIRGNMKFKGNLLTDSLNADTIFGIPTRDFAFKSHSNTFRSPIVFINNFKAKLVDVTAVSGIRIPQDIVLATNIQGMELKRDVTATMQAMLSEPVHGVVINENLRNEIFLQGEDQLVTSKVFFDRVVMRRGGELMRVNGMNFTKLIDSFILRDHSGPIYGCKQAKNASEETLAILATLNGTPFPDGFLQLGQKDVTIYGVKTFSSMVVDAATVDSAVNNMRPNNMVKLSPTGHESNSCNWTMHNFVIFKGNTVIKEAMGGKDVSHFHFQDSLTDVKPHYYPNHNIRFDSPVTTKSLTIKNRVNNKSVDETFANAVTCDKESDLQINGTTYFKNGIKLGNLTVSSDKLNATPLVNFLNRNMEQNFTSSIVFQNPVHFEDLLAKSLVDGINFDEQLRDVIWLNEDQDWPPTLRFDYVNATHGLNVEGSMNQFDNFRSDIAVKVGRSQQTFTSEITLSELRAESFNARDLRMSHAINGIDFDQWLDERISLRRNTTFAQPVEIKGLTQAGNIQTDSVNGEILEFLWSNALRSNTRQQIFVDPVVIYGTLFTQASFQVQKKLCEYNLNDVIRDSFHVSDGPVNVAEKWRMEMAIFKNLTVLGKTCGVDVRHLAEDSFMNSASNITVKATITFNGDVTVKDWSVFEQLNNMERLSQLFCLSQDQEINNDFTWKSAVQVRSGLIVKGRVRNISLDGISRQYSFSDSTHVLRAANVKFQPSFMSKSLFIGGHTGGINLGTLLDSTVKVKSNATQIVDGNLTFSLPIKSAGDLIVKSVNGISASKLERFLLKKGDNETFMQPVCFDGGLSAEKLVVVNNDVIVTIDEIDGIYLADLKLESININSLSEIRLIVLSNENTSVLNNIDGVEKINGVTVGQMLSRTTSQKIPRLKVSFLKIDQNDLATRGRFGGIDIRKEYDNTVLINGSSATVVGKKTFSGTVIMRDNLYSNSSVVDHLVCTEGDGDYSISQPVTFVDDVYVMGDMIVDGTWNGLPLEDLEKHGVSTDNSNTIGGPWNFAGGLVLRQPAVSLGLVDGLNATRMDADGRKNVNKYDDEIADEKDEYLKLCHYFQKLYNETSRGPLQLHAFDDHQTLITSNKVKNMLVASVKDRPYLLVASEFCQVELYKWSHEEDLFYQDTFILRGATVQKWESFPVKNQAVIVFTSSFSTSCAGSLVLGLYTAILNESGDILATDLVTSGDIIDFKVVSIAPSTNLMLSISEHNPEILVVKVWNATVSKFQVEATLHVHGMHSIQVVSLNGNFLLVYLHGGAETLVYKYYVVEKRFSDYNVAGFAWSSQQMKFFHADSGVYAINPTVQLETTKIKPANTLQLLRITPDGEELVQQLETLDFVAMEIAQLGSQVYVLVLTKPVGLYVYKFMGLSGLQKVSPYPLKFHHGESLAVFGAVPWSYDVPLPFALISRMNMIKMLHSNVVGNAIVDIVLADRVSSMC